VVCRWGHPATSMSGAAFSLSRRWTEGSSANKTYGEHAGGGSTAGNGARSAAPAAYRALGCLYDRSQDAVAACG
jgi:hypothetical protein